MTSTDHTVDHTARRYRYVEDGREGELGHEFCANNSSTGIALKSCWFNRSQPGSYFLMRLISELLEGGIGGCEIDGLK